MKDSIEGMRDSVQVELKTVAPYVAYKTFRNFLDGLGETMPTRVDRSLMSTMSGATQGQLISALRYLDLSTKNDLPTDRLRDLHKAKGPEHKALFRKMIVDGYPFLCGGGFDLKATTIQHLEEQFRNETGASGATIDRCINFFKAAAKDAGIELSPHLAKSRPRRSRSTNGASRKARSKAQVVDVSGGTPPPPRKPSNSKTVSLRSGAGEITLSYDVDLFEMDSADQQFVLGLVSKMKEYEDAAEK